MFTFIIWPKRWIIVCALAHASANLFALCLCKANCFGWIKILMKKFWQALLRVDGSSCNCATACAVVIYWSKFVKLALLLLTRMFPLAACKLRARCRFFYVCSNGLRRLVQMFLRSLLFLSNLDCSVRVRLFRNWKTVAFLLLQLATSLNICWCRANCFDRNFVEHTLRLDFSSCNVRTTASAVVTSSLFC